MKHLGKQSRHLTVCPDLCQAWGQNGELMQHVITGEARCQGYTCRLNCTHPPGHRRVHHQGGTGGCNPGLVLPQPQSWAAVCPFLSSSILL